MNHQRAGKIMRQMNEDLVHISVEAYNAKGKRARKVSAKISKALSLLQDARSELEEDMFQGDPNSELGTYFGPADGEA